MVILLNSNRLSSDYNITHPRQINYTSLRDFNIACLINEVPAKLSIALTTPACKRGGISELLGHSI